MSLIGALNVGASALAVASASLQVTGNNIANASDPNYTRETSDLSPGLSQQITPGVFVGTGVDLTGVTRQIDSALNARLLSANSDASGTAASQQWLTQVQSTFNELSGQGLSTQLSTFFNSWSALANNPTDTGLRQVVIQDGQDLAGAFQDERTQLTTLQGSANSQIQGLAANADSLSSQIATLNGQIVAAQGGTGGTANGLEDQRDALLTQLSSLINVQTVNQPDGAVNVYAGSSPLVLNAQSRGVAVKQQSVNGELTSSLVFKSDNSTMDVSSGQLGALIGVQGQISGVINQFDTLTNNIISSVNNVYSSGQGLAGFSSVTATNSVTNTGAALDTAAAGLNFAPTNGSFVLHVQQPSGLETSTLVQVNLGQGTNGTSLTSLANSLNAISGVSATITGGALTIAATNSSDQLTFSQDSSGVLGALGINTFFSGSNASNIAVNSTVAADLQMLAAAQNGESDDNQTALAISALQSQPQATMQGASITDSYQSIINNIANTVSSTTNDATAAQNVQQALQSQQQSISGVSINEETINLLQQQQAFQGAARVISVVDLMMQTLMNIT